MWPLLTRLRLPLFFLVLASVLTLHWEEIAQTAHLDANGLGQQTGYALLAGATWLTGANFSIRFIQLFVWEGIVLSRTGQAVPRLLIDLTNGLIWTITFVIIIAVVLDKPITGIVATSGVMVAVVGFALKSMISDLFSGIAITLECPFRIGDWIELNTGILGKVETVTWRATGITMKNDIYVVIPNSRLSEMVLKVYSRPGLPWRDEIDITFPYETTAYQVERILLSAANGVPEVAALTQRPDVRIAEYGDHGVKWRLRFWVPDTPSHDRVRYQVNRNILRNIHFSGVNTAVPRLHANFFRSAKEFDHMDGRLAVFLRGIDLFKPLKPDELAEICEGIMSRLCLANEEVITYGEEGDSLFIVKEGLFKVSIPDKNGLFKVVTSLRPGTFFGEMSLLTGENRSATVVASIDSLVLEISKEILQPLLNQRTELVEKMSLILAERQMANTTALHQLSEVELLTTKQSLSNQFLKKIRTFFSL